MSDSKNRPDEDHDDDTDTPLAGDDLSVAAAWIDEAASAEPVAVDPDLAEAMGAFAEDALSPEDALDSLFPAQENEAPEGGDDGL